MAQWLESCCPFKSFTKQNVCLPHYKLPDGWHITATPNHWSNEVKTKEYIEKIIIPYVKRKRLELKLSADHSALTIFNVFKGQMTEEVFSMLEENNIHVVKVPANCTDRLQPMDLSVNKSMKELMHSKFQQWYASEVEKQLDQGIERAPVDLRMSIMKPLGARWLVSLHDYLQENNSIIKNGFKAAGIVKF